MLPIACTLSDPQMAHRRVEILTGVLREAREIEPLADGYRWRFPSSPGIFNRLGMVIDAERECCRFLTFHMRADPELGDVVLEVTGPEGTKAFLSDWLP